MTNPEFQAALDELTRELEEIDVAIAKREDEIAALTTTRAALVGELRGLERGYAMRSYIAPVAEKPARQPIEKPIMALFQPGQGSWDEAGIVERTGLPQKAVRDCLNRLVRIGKLRREKIGRDVPDHYRLPPRHAGALEAAE